MSPSRSIAIDYADGRRRLLVDGIVQSVEVGSEEQPAGFWPAMLPSRRPRRVLLLGLGGGTVAQLLRQRFGPLPITGVDDDPEIIALAREQFALDNAVSEVVQADAFAALCADRGRYDLILVDLFRGEELPVVAASRPFLRRLCRTLSPGGLLIWNLHRDRRGILLRRRLRQRLRQERAVLVGLNLVLHLRRRSARRCDD